LTERAEGSELSLQGLEWLLAIALLVVFTPAVIDLAEVWSRYEYYSHGYLVPLAALWAATAQRNALRRLPRHRSGVGGAVLALSLLLYLLGRLAAIVSLQGVALVICVAGAIYFARGLAWVRSLSFSIGYLIFMVPVPQNWITPFIAKLQLFVSAAAIRVVHLLDLPVYREGNVMHLPSGDSLFVAEACSGITSILTLVPLAVFLAYFTQRTQLRRLFLVIAVIPLAMLGNLARVVITIWVAQRFGSQLATADWLHTVAGLLTYVLGCLALLALGSLMTRWVPIKKTVQPQ